MPRQTGQNLSVLLLFVLLLGVLLLGPLAGASLPSSDQALLHMIPSAPPGATPREQYEWNKRHYFALVEKRRHEAAQHLHDITKVDPSTFKSQDFGDFERICMTDYTATALTSKGKKIKMLGVAFVNFDRAEGPSAWGHVAERFLYCVGDEFRDDLFEYLPLRENLLEVIDFDLQRRFGIALSSLSPEYVKSLLSSHYASYTSFPFQSYYQLVQRDENRTIFEVWMKTSEQNMYEMFRRNTGRLNEQLKSVRDQKPLPHYNLITNNCATLVSQDFEIINPAYLAKFHGPLLTPSFMFKYIKKLDVERIVIYPSQRLFRLMQMKERGESTFLENFAPFSKASKGALRSGWVFFYPESQSRWKQLMLKPLGGVLNSGAAIVETVWGFLTLPLNLLGRIPAFKKLHSQERGGYRIKSGLSNLMWSFAEIMTLRVRYEKATPWTEDELKFLQGFEQTTALLEFMRAKYDVAPVIIENTISETANRN